MVCSPWSGFQGRQAVIYAGARARYGLAMLNRATGHTSAFKPPFGAGLVVRVVH